MKVFVASIRGSEGKTERAMGVRRAINRDDYALAANVPWNPMLRDHDNRAIRMSGQPAAHFADKQPVVPGEGI
ncbi:MAG: hypothetical protein ACXWDB_07655, partial [Aeromicrobium sp.]